MRLLLALILTTPFLGLQAQIRLSNPSFEGEPQDATTPTGWMPCNDDSTPDILPGVWGVHTDPSDGETYIGLISRSDGSWEDLAQRLVQPIESGECYSFQVDLARAPSYSGYRKPLKLRLWAGSNRCGKDQLLGESQLVNHTNWKTYTFSFTAKKKYNYIILEAFFDNKKLLNYKGNLLIDACSTIKPCIRAEKQTPSIASNRS